jgi:hypothetical protein
MSTPTIPDPDPVAAFLAAKVRAEHATLEALQGRTWEPHSPAELEQLAQRTHDIAVVEQYLARELAARRAVAR